MPPPNVPQGSLIDAHLMLYGSQKGLLTFSSSWGPRHGAQKCAGITGRNSAGSRLLCLNLP